MDILKCNLLLRYFQIFIALFLCVFSFTHGNVYIDEEQVLHDLKRFGVFYSKEPLLNILRDSQHADNLNVRSLLNAYDYECNPSRMTRPLRHDRYPFFIVEGTSKTRRNAISKMLANGISGKLLGGLPTCVKHLRHKFQREPNLKRMFYALGFYIKSCIARNLLNDSPVVTDGFWMDQAAFHISKMFDEVNLPPANSSIYNFPEDLLKPDLVLYHNVYQNIAKPDLVEYFKHIDKIYLSMRNPEVSVLEMDEPLGTDLSKIIREKVVPKFPHLPFLREDF